MIGGWLRDWRMWSLVILSIVALAMLGESAVTFVVGGLVVIAPAFHFVAYLILREASRKGERIAALEDRREAAGWWLFGSGLIAAVILNFLLGRPVDLQPPWSQLVIGLALLAGSVPAVRFLYRNWAGKFGVSEPTHDQRIVSALERSAEATERLADENGKP